MLVWIANREDPDQTASLEAVWSETAQFVSAFLAGIYHIVRNFKHSLYAIIFLFYEMFQWTSINARTVIWRVLLRRVWDSTWSTAILKRNLTNVICVNTGMWL